MVALCLSWAALEGGGRLGLLSLVTFSTALTAEMLERRGYRESAVVEALWSQLLLVTLGYALSVFERESEPLPWAIVTTVSAAVTFALALRRRSPVLSALASLTVAAAMILYGKAIETGRPEGPAIWALVSSLPLAVLAFFGHRRGKENLGAPPALVGVLLALASAGLGLFGFLKPELRIFSIAWPYSIAALLLGAGALLSRGESSPYGSGLGAAGALVLLLVPAAHAIVNEHASSAYLRGAQGAGTGLVIVALTRKRIARSFEIGTGMLLVGLAHVIASRSPAYVTSVLTGMTFAFALREKSVGLSFLASLGASLAVVLWAVAHEVETTEARAVWALGGGAVLAGLGLLLRRRVGEGTDAPAAALSLLFLLASWLLGLTPLPHLWEHGYAGPSDTEWAFNVAWPYVAIAIAVLGSHGLGRIHALEWRAGALVVAGLMLLVTPSFHSFHYGKLPYLYAGSIVGALVIVAAFRWNAIAENEGSQIGAILVGLVSLVVAPGLLTLGNLGPKDGDALLGEVLDPKLPFAERLEHPLGFLSHLTLTSVVLVFMGVVFSRSAERKLPYRILEVAGLFLFLGTLSILSCARWNELFYPAVLLVGGLAALVAGVHERHLLLAAIPAVFLVLNMWFQYFAKLSGSLPLGLLLVGFGIGILAGGFFFEKRIRPMTDELRRWR
ncbi:hypothetical protein HY251_17725 [bacterium]|nr:hypothetical protein [bacterium]